MIFKFALSCKLLLLLMFFLVVVVFAMDELDIVQVAVDAADGEYHFEHVSSRLARLQARQKSSHSNGHSEDQVLVEIKQERSVDTHNDVSVTASSQVNESEMTDLELLHGLVRLGRAAPTPVGKRVAVGWNSNVDMIVSGCDVVRRDFPTPNPRDVDIITSLEDFADSFAFWFEKGAAAERFVESAEVFKKIIELSKSQSRRLEFKTGGNAALMATALASDSCQCDVLLGGLVGPQLVGLLSPTIRTVSNREGSADGFDDAVHLIMEYDRGEGWDSIISPRHNRFIVVHDEYNAKIAGLESLSESIISEIKNRAGFDVFIASGLNQLEGLPSVIRDERLSVVVSHMSKIVATTPIHLELASMANREFLRKMFSALCVHSDSMGLNEEELAMLYEVLGGEYAENDHTATVDSFTREMLTGRVPQPRAVSLALFYVLKQVEMLYRAGDISSLRLVSRLHFHSLSFHIIVTRDNYSKEQWRWTNRMDVAVSRGATAAAAKACDVTVDELDDNHIDFLIPSTFEIISGKTVQLSRHNPVGTWNFDGFTFHLAPVPVCKEPKNTVGLGDAISANALAYSLM